MHTHSSILLSRNEPATIPSSNIIEGAADRLVHATGNFRRYADDDMSDATALRAMPAAAPNRSIHGMAAVLLPFDAAGDIDWSAFAAHIERVVAAGLVPAVNMDTGYVQLLDTATRAHVLELAQKHAGGAFVAGALVADEAGAAFDLDRYRVEIERVEAHGGLPIVFPSHGLNGLPESDWLGAHSAFAEQSDRFLAFELGSMFVPYGRIYSLDTWRALLDIPACVGSKHSSLSRQLEWDRLAVRDEARPDFMLLTGNDLAIDMVMYGSDYLLGLATFAPDYFALRDTWWRDGDPRFFELNDLLQYLGMFAFREPVPAYRHSAAQFLALRGHIESDRTHPGSPARPASDVAILRDILQRLEATAP